MKINTYTEQKLSEYSKTDLIRLVLNQQKDTEALNRKLDLLIEQVSLANQQRFGQKSERTEIFDQMSIYLNEAEDILQGSSAEEPEIGYVVKEHVRKSRPKGKREEDLKGLPVTVIEHTIPELFGGKYHRLPDEVYKKLAYHPATFEVEEHHIAVYAGGKDQTVVKADRPCELLKNSIATPSLVAGILNAKYVNAIPIHRMEQEFKRNDINLSRQVMSHWAILSAERYLPLIYDRMHKALYDASVINADETPFKVMKDGRPASTNSYMWVYHTGKYSGAPPIFLYEYTPTRKTDHPRTFLKAYNGVVVCDGYQPYHIIESERPDELTVAGCWVHAKRRFSQICKSLGKAAKGTTAQEANNLIAAIFHVDKMVSGDSPDEKFKHRKNSVEPLVNSFFEWASRAINTVEEKSATWIGLQYCLNQEKYLRAFLSDPRIPMDNNDAERSIRSFCVGRKNWHIIDTVGGAKSSAIHYSIAETAKANKLKPYEYFKYLLTEIPKHMDDTDLSFLDALLPWSASLPDVCTMQP